MKMRKNEIFTTWQSKGKRKNAMVDSTEAFTAGLTFRGLDMFLMLA
jgi:hypothetical protein